MAQPRGRRLAAISAASAPSARLERMRSMKRLLLVAVLAAAVLGLLAAPALAATPHPDFRLAEKTAYIFSYWDGSWFEVKDVADPFSFVGHWTTYDDDGNFVAPADPIPADYDIVMQVSIKLIPRGQVQNLAKKFLISLSIPEAGVGLSYRAVEGLLDPAPVGPVLGRRHRRPDTGLQPEHRGPALRQHMAGAADRRERPRGQPHGRHEAPPRDLHRQLHGERGEAVHRP